MTETERTPTLGEVIEARIATELESMHTAIPGRVVKYDPATQKADVQPLVRSAYLDEDGLRQTASLPVVPSCPVAFPGGSGLVVTFPVAVGDFGLLIFAESSLDKWLAGSGGEVDPQFDHRHHLSDAVFIPGVRPFGAARSTNPGNAVCIGVDGGAFQGAALGHALVTWLNAHVHTSGGSGSPTSPPTIAAIDADFVSASVKITP